MVTDDGLIGRVDQVGGGWAQIALLTGTGAVTARVAGKGPEGLVEPIVGDPGKLSFTLIQEGGEMKEGDDLVTAGFSNGALESRYPGDIPIGRISETIPDQQQQIDEVRIEPFADVNDLQDVSVLTGGPS